MSALLDKQTMNRVESGLVSIIIVTYNRSKSIHRTIESLLDQTYKKLEIIIIDNGCTDDTPQILNKYQTTAFRHNIRIFTLPENRRFCGGINFALDQIKGEWFGILDDDDLAYPDAIEKMMRIPLEIDPQVTAVNCNVINSSTKKFAGIGPVQSQYLTIKDVVGNCSGDFWGITKTELVGDHRFNEELIGSENTFWWALSLKAKRYYIHEGLRIWTTDEGPTISKFLAKKDPKQKARNYRALLKENAYWYCLQQYDVKTYHSKCIKGMIYLYMDGDLDGKLAYYLKLKNSSNLMAFLIKVSTSLPRSIFRILYSVVTGSFPGDMSSWWKRHGELARMRH